MMYCSQWFTFEIPDEWWNVAGMRGFKTDRKVYRQSPQSGAAEDTTIIRLVDNIGPLPRSSSVLNLHRYRMISMLRAIRFDRAMSPIVVSKTSGQGYSHTLYSGSHRLTASIAVGYPLVPTVIRGHHDEVKRTDPLRGVAGAGRDARSVASRMSEPPLVAALPSKCCRRNSGWSLISATCCRQSWVPPCL
jgi:hypothetical protein